MIDHSKAPWVDPTLGWKPLPVPELPERLLIDFATKCNLRCPMCPVWGSEDNNAIDSVKGVMDLEASKRLIEEMAPAHPLIQPNMYGEPLLVPNLRERLADMKSRGISIAMNTNGLTLDDDLAKFMVEIEVDAISFSIDAVSREALMKIRGIDKIEKIEAAVFRMLAARGARRLPRISVSFTLQDANRHEEAAFVERWSGLVDCVRVGLLFENGTFPDMKRAGEAPALPDALQDACRFTTTARSRCAASTASRTPMSATSSTRASRRSGRARNSPKSATITRPASGTKCRSARTATAGRNTSSRTRFATDF